MGKKNLPHTSGGVSGSKPATIIFCMNCKRWCASTSTKITRKECPYCQGHINVKTTQTEVVASTTIALKRVQELNKKTIKKKTLAEMISEGGNDDRND